MAKGNERNDSRGGIGLGGPQDGAIGGGGSGRQQQDDEAGGAGSGELGQGQQRHPGGSSRDSEKLG